MYACVNYFALRSRNDLSSIVISPAVILSVMIPFFLSNLWSTGFSRLPMILQHIRSFSLRKPRFSKVHGRFVLIGCSITFAVEVGSFPVSVKRGYSLTGETSCEESCETDFFLLSLFLIILALFLLGDRLLLCRAEGPAEPFTRAGIYCYFAGFKPFSLKSLNFLMNLRR